MHRTGFAAAGIRDITEAAGVPKGSFYSYFVSKEEFAAAVLVYYWDPIQRDLLPLLDDDPLEAVPAPARIARFFRALADEHESHDFALGCLVGLFSLELGASSETAKRELDRIFQQWEEALAQCLRTAGTDGGPYDDRSPDEVAALLIEAWEGAALRGKVARSRVAYDRFEHTVLPLLLRPQRIARA